MEKKVFTMWEMNLGFRPKDFQSVWGGRNPEEQSEAVLPQGKGSQTRAWACGF